MKINMEYNDNTRTDEEPIVLEFARRVLSQKTLYSLAAKKGFYPESWTLPTALMGVVSEAAEAYEDWRCGATEEKIVEELSDVIARCMGIAEHLGKDVFEAMFKKFIENHERPERHGKVNI